MRHSLLNSSGSLPFPRGDPSARSLNLPPDATRLSCLQLIMRHDLLFLLFCILHLTFPHVSTLPPPPTSRWSSTLRGPQPTCHCSTCSFADAVGWGGRTGRRAGRQEGRRDVNMRTFGLPAKRRGRSLQHGTHSFESGRRPAVWPGN